MRKIQIKSENIHFPRVEVAHSRPKDTLPNRAGTGTRRRPTTAPRRCGTSRRRRTASRPYTWPARRPARISRSSRPPRRRGSALRWRRSSRSRLSSTRGARLHRTRRTRTATLLRRRGWRRRGTLMSVPAPRRKNGRSRTGVSARIRRSTPGATPKTARSRRRRRLSSRTWPTRSATGFGHRPARSGTPAAATCSTSGLGVPLFHPQVPREARRGARQVGRVLGRGD